MTSSKHFKAADRAAREGRWRGATNLLFKGKTIGIIGVGRIGSRVAHLLRPFEVRFRGYDPYVPPEELRRRGVEPTALDVLLSESDFVTVHAVVTREPESPTRPCGECRWPSSKTASGRCRGELPEWVVNPEVVPRWKERRAAKAR